MVPVLPLYMRESFVHVGLVATMGTTAEGEMTSGNGGVKWAENARRLSYRLSFGIYLCFRD